MSQVDIQTLSADDWEVWREVRLRSLADAPDAFGSKLADWQGPNDREDRWRQRFDDVGFTAVAVGSAGAVGTVGAIQTDEATVELISMWVAPEMRGRGASERLIEAVVAWATLQGARRLTLSVMENNTYAQELYRRAGFVVGGRSPHAACEQEMIRDLDADGAAR